MLFRKKTIPMDVLAVLAIATALTLGQACAAEGTATDLIGKRIEDFTLDDTAGTPHALSKHLGGKGVALIFVSTRCPVSNAYNERMAGLAARYGDKGFVFLGINANKSEDPTEIADHASRNGWTFPVLKDTGNVIADRFGASVTPEVYLLDGEGVLRYHGRIDDSQDPDGVKSRDFEAALDAILAGQEITRKEAKAFGCTIKRV